LFLNILYVICYIATADACHHLVFPLSLSMGTLKRTPADA
jgi:hypothetical protein